VHERHPAYTRASAHPGKLFLLTDAEISKSENFGAEIDGYEVLRIQGHIEVRMARWDLRETLAVRRLLGDAEMFYAGVRSTQRVVCYLRSSIIPCQQQYAELPAGW
jgi:hypothetical protein